jgi:hypothetical protein
VVNKINKGSEKREKQAEKGYYEQKGGVEGQE